MTGDAVQAAIELARVLEDLGVPYLIGGSLASTVWGEPRFTQDVDVVAALEARHVAGLLAGLGERWYADEVAIRDAIERRSSFNAIRIAGMSKVDVFVPPDEGLHASKWGRARLASLTVGGGPVLSITSPEDIVLQKLDWFREGGGVSEQQWRDVTALLRIRTGQLDEKYLDEWARRMGLEELLARAREEADL